MYRLNSRGIILKKMFKTFDGADKFARGRVDGDMMKIESLQLDGQWAQVYEDDKT